MVANLQTGDSIDCKTLIEKTVCNPKSKEYMLHGCKDCPGEEALMDYLHNQIRNHYDYDDITIQQWQHTDRTTLITRSLKAEEYIADLSNKVDVLTAYDFIAKSQNDSLKNLKEHLEWALQ